MTEIRSGIVSLKRFVHVENRFDGIVIGLSLRLLSLLLDLEMARIFLRECRTQTLLSRRRHFR